MTQALLVIGGLFLLVYVPLAILAWKRPLLARFAWRESTRRPGHFALLVVGLLVGSACITASMVGADTGTQSLAHFYDQRLGSVDLTVTANGRSFPIDVAHQLASDQGLSRYVDGVQAGLEQPASVGDLDQRLGRSDVLMVGFDPAAQRRFGAYTLSDGRRTFGADLAPGDVLLSDALATAIDARAGDRLRISTGSVGPAADLRVSGIAIASGPGAYGSRLAVFVPLATAQLIAGDNGINVVRVAARGGTPGDLEPARLAAAPLASALAAIPGSATLKVTDVRLDASRQLEDQTAWELGTTLGFSGLVILAAVALILNLILALAEERRPRLAILRALGLSRAGLIGLSVLEGAIYSLAAATAGVAVGIVAGLYLGGAIWHALVIDPGAHAYVGTPVELTVSPATLAIAFAAGALITLGTFAAAAYRTSRLAIASAVRDLPDPASPVRDRWLRTVLLAGLAVLGALMLIPNNSPSRLAGGVALIASTTALARGRLSDRARGTLAGLLLFAWAAFMVDGFTNWNDMDLVLAFFAAVAIAAIGLTLTAAANLRLIESVPGLLANRFGLVQATLRPPLAYLSRRPLRTGLATSAFAMVLVMVTVIAVYVASFQRDFARDAAGFDIRVVTAGPDPIQVPGAVEPQVARQVALPMRLYRGPMQSTGFFGEGGATAQMMFYVLPDQPSDTPPVYLINREKRFASNEAAWQAVRSEPGLVVIMGGTGVNPGDPITLQGVNGPLRLRVAGSQAGSMVEGIIASPGTIAQIDTRPAGSTLLLQTKPGTDSRTLARQIELSLFSQGVQATSSREILDQFYQSSIEYATEYDVLLHLGLLVGVLALTMVGIRAAIERRRAIGILRSLGYQPPRVIAGLLTEATLTATIGVATGVGAGLVTASFLISSGVEAGAVFGVDAARMGLALIVVYGGVLIVTTPLASRVARMAPTEAIRITG